MTTTDYQIARAVLLLANTVTKTRNAHLKYLGITAGQADAINFFDEHPNSTITALKNGFHIQHATAQMLIQRLIKKNLISLSVDPTDRRAKRVQLTDAGLKVRHQLKTNGVNTGAKLLAGFSQTDTAQFAAALHTAYLNLTNEEA